MVGWVWVIMAIDTEVASDYEIWNIGSQIKKRCKFVDERWKRLGVVGWVGWPMLKMGRWRERLATVIEMASNDCIAVGRILQARCDLCRLMLSRHECHVTSSVESHNFTQYKITHWLLKMINIVMMNGDEWIMTCHVTEGWRSFSVELVKAFHALIHRYRHYRK